MRKMEEKNELNTEEGTVEPSLSEKAAFAQASDRTPEDEFVVISETVKKRPFKKGKFFKNILAVAGAAVLFGLIAAFVFSKIISYLGVNTSDLVQFDPDPTPTPTETPTPTPEPEPTETPTPAIEETEPDYLDIKPPFVVPTPTPTPSPTPDPATESEERIRQNQKLYSDLRRISTEPSHAVVTVTGITTTEDWFNVTDESRRTASGVIVATSGLNYLILTDWSVMDGASRTLVTFYDNTIVDAALIRSDPNTGLGILSVSRIGISASTRENLVVATLGNSYNSAVGEPIIAIGAPMGYSGAVVFGQITSLTNKINLTDGGYSLIMTNIQGASGGSGVLVNLDGQIIGFIAQKYAEQSGTGTITALPISQLKQLLEILSNRENIAYLGISGEDVTTELSDRFQIPVGIYITDVIPDSPAFAAGIQRGDILCRVGDSDVNDMVTLGNILREGMAGTVQSVLVRRLGANGYVDLELTVEIGAI